MFLIKHSVADKGDNTLWDETLPQGYFERAECKPVIDALLADYDHSGYDEKLDHWWSRMDADPEHRHYWWIEAAKP
jgi:hypothetical protein